MTPKISKNKKSRFSILMPSPPFRKRGLERLGKTRQKKLQFRTKSILNARIDPLTDRTGIHITNPAGNSVTTGTYILYGYKK